MTSPVLTADQQAGQAAFDAFYLDPLQTVFVLTGYSGTGKSTTWRCRGRDITFT